MKSIFACALLFSVSAYFNGVQAVEHATLIDTSDFVPEWYDKDNLKNSYENHKTHIYSRKVDNQIRPVIGVLSEPFRGQVSQMAGSNEYESDASEYSSFSYIPRTHVQYLEQAGVRVIPIDYNMDKDDMMDLLSQVSGVYMPGDSHMSVTDEKYKNAFVDIIYYAES